MSGLTWEMFFTKSPLCIVVLMSALKNRVRGEASKLPLTPDNEERKRAFVGLSKHWITSYFIMRSKEMFSFPRCYRGEAETAGYLTTDHAEIESVAKRLQIAAMEF